MTKYLIALIAILSLIYFVWLNGNKSGKNEIKIEQQQQINKTQNEIIKQNQEIVRAKINQQKIISKPAKDNDPANRIKWLQAIWEKQSTDNPDK